MIVVIREGKRFYMEAREMAKYEAGEVSYISREGKRLALKVLSNCAPGFNVMGKRVKQ